MKQSNSTEKPVLGVSDLKRVFDKFDTDRDGKISSRELEAAMRRLGQPPASDEELQMTMEDMDSNRDGLVDASEFLDYYANVLDVATSMLEMEQAFSVFDLDCDGLISDEELQMTLINLGEEVTLKQCQSMIQVFDCDGDGCINFEELKIMLCSADVRKKPRKIKAMDFGCNEITEEVLMYAAGDSYLAFEIEKKCL